MDQVGVLLGTQVKGSADSTFEVPASESRSGVFSSSLAMVVFQQTAQPLTALDFARTAPDFISRSDDLVVQALVVSFAMKVIEILANSISQCTLTKEDHP